MLLFDDQEINAALESSSTLLHLDLTPQCKTSDETSQLLFWECAALHGASVDLALMVEKSILAATDKLELSSREEAAKT